jgi:glycosyltransferase involved in cell wall biosynthesis
MIVKNEEEVIERAIRSASRFIETWIIVDTGSTDKTKEIIRRTFEELQIPGLIYDRPWTNFAHNRTEALKLSKHWMKWAIMLDADDTMEGNPIPQAFFDETHIDGYTVELHYNGQIARRVQIFKLLSDWEYQGAVHEVPKIEKGGNIADLPNQTFMTVRSEGSRSKDPNRFLNDAELLFKQFLDEKAKEKLNEHTIYHLANSLRSAGKLDEAIKYYQMCIDMPKAWVQCKYMAYVNIIYYSSDVQTKLFAAKKANELFEDRLEAQYALLKQLPVIGEDFEAEVYEIGKASKNRKPDLDAYLVHPDIYHWMLDWEMSILAFNLKHFQEAYDFGIQCLLNCPEKHRTTTIKMIKLLETKK